MTFHTEDPVTVPGTDLLQGQKLLFLSVLQGLALGVQRLPLFFQPHHFVLQPAPLVVQVPDGGFLGHLVGLQAAYLTCSGIEARDVRRMLPTGDGHAAVHSLSFLEATCLGNNT